MTVLLLAQIQADSAAAASPAVIAALIGAMVLGCITFLVSGRLEPRFVGAFGLLAALSAGFGLFAALIPSGNEWVGLAVFVVTVGFFRLLSASNPSAAERMSPTRSKNHGTCR